MSDWPNSWMPVIDAVAFVAVSYWGFVAVFVVAVAWFFWELWRAPYMDEGGDE